MSQVKPYMRFSRLTAWLEGYGFSATQVERMVKDGVIPRTHFPVNYRLKKGQKGPRKVRAYYELKAVAAKLGIELGETEFNNSRQTNPDAHRAPLQQHPDAHRAPLQPTDHANKH